MQLLKEFEYMMSKIRTYHRSKRFVSQLTTILRALQFSMNLGYNGTANSQFPGQQKKVTKDKKDQALSTYEELKMTDT